MHSYSIVFFVEGYTSELQLQVADIPVIKILHH